MGIGKTALWNQGLASAAERGLRVLRPAGECETQLAYAALGDLLAGVPEEAMSELPAPQRHALEVALLRAEPDGPAAAAARDRPRSPRTARYPGRAGADAARDRRRALARLTLRERARVRRAAVAGRAGRHLLRPAGQRSGDTARPRPRAARALRADGARRPGRERPRHAAAHGSRRAAAEEDGRARVARVGRQPLLRARDRPRAGRARRAARAGGRAADPEQPAGARPRPAGTAARGGARSRADRCRALAADGASSSSRPRARRSSRPRPSLRACSNATASASRSPTRCSRRSPTSSSPPPSGAVPRPPRRDPRRPRGAGAPPRLAAERPDEAVASRSRPPRGGPRRAAPGCGCGAAGAGAPLHAGRPRRHARRRGIEAAERHFEAGEDGRARSCSRRSSPTPRPATCARCAHPARLGVHAQGGHHAGADVFLAALAEPTDDVRLRIETSQGLAWSLHSSRATRPPRCTRELRSSWPSGSASGPCSPARSRRRVLESVGGDGIATATIERALALEHAPAGSQMLGRPRLGPRPAARLGRPPRRSPEWRFDALRREALDSGDEHSLATCSSRWRASSCLTGDWASARRHARGVPTRRRSATGRSASGRTSLDDPCARRCARGRVRAALATRSRRALQLADRVGVLPAVTSSCSPRAASSSSRSATPAAARPHARHAFAEAGRSAGSANRRLPLPRRRDRGASRRSASATGRQRLVDELEQLAAELSALAARRRGPRARAAALGARRARAAPTARSEEAIAHGERLGEPFERARTLLVLGSVQRRDRKKRAARESLERALETFEWLGARLWAERARGELARIGGRAPDRRAHADRGARRRAASPPA